MESPKKQIMVLVFIEAWYIADFETEEILQGPYEVIDDAEQALLTRAYRIAKGWNP